MDKISSIDKQYFPSLDGVRGIAIILVILYHSWQISGIVCGNIIDKIVAAIARRGDIGVDLFFVLSGFLITGILLSSKGKKNYFRNFYLRRTLRIFPIYYLYLFLVFNVVAHFYPPLRMGFSDQLWFWAYLSNLKWFFSPSNVIIPGLGHLWSLAIEEQFYLCWPFLVAFIQPRNIKKVLIGIFCFSLFTRIILYSAGYDNWHVKIFYFAKIDMLAAGALLAVLYREKKLNVNSKHNIYILSLVLFLAIAIHFSSFYINGVFHEAFRQTLLGVILSYFIIAAIRCPSESLFIRVLSSKPLVLTGKYSYSMYLFQSGVIRILCHFLMPVFNKYIHSAALIWCSLFILSYAISYSIAWFTYRYFERFFLDLKDVLAPSEPNGANTVHSA